jgi:hypothetical protein
VSVSYAPAEATALSNPMIVGCPCRVPSGDIQKSFRLEISVTGVAKIGTKS